MTKRSIVLFCSFLLISSCFVVLDSSLLWAKDKSKPLSGPVFKSNWQSESEKNSNQVVPYRIIKDPRDQSIQVSESTMVDIRFTKEESEPWARYTLSATQWDWTVRRPGDYSAKCLTGEVTGNVNIAIDFSGFGDLSSTDANGQTVEAYYGAFLGDKTVEQVIWSRASDFNGQVIPIPASPEIPIFWSLWNKISVTSRASANNYSDDAVITFGMVNLAPWSDPDIPPGQ